MRDYIIKRLKEIEVERKIKIIYACESGSRAWGFSSKDSDYDVRFIYVNQRDWYLSINEKQRDTIEIMDKEKDLDFVGWDIRKTLRLLKKSNPAVLEWINSPIEYITIPDVLHDLESVAAIYYSPKSLLFHYLHMARGNIREYLRSKDEVWLKKYLYVVRPLMACNWIMLYNSIPPVNFQHMYLDVINDSEHMEAALIEDLHGLILRKREGDELSYGPIIPSIHSFIEQEVKRLSEKETQEKWPQHATPKNVFLLNETFRKVLNEYA